MRRDCRHYESRTYASGEGIERCKIDLAPEAPWRCPDECPGYAKRMIDAGWQYGSMAQPRGEEHAERPEPEGEDVAALLDEMQFVVNAAAPEVVADLEKQNRRKGLFRRKSKASGKGATKKSKKKRGKKRR
jgi:hypothetical protein